MHYRSRNRPHGFYSFKFYEAFGRVWGINENQHLLLAVPTATPRLKEGSGKLGSGLIKSRAVTGWNRMSLFSLLHPVSDRCSWIELVGSQMWTPSVLMEVQGIANWQRSGSKGTLQGHANVTLQIKSLQIFGYLSRGLCINLLRDLRDLTR